MEVRQMATAFLLHENRVLMMKRLEVSCLLLNFGAVLEDIWSKESSTLQ